ncbi:MAG: tetratricopeptide repeat protein, partial [Terracidiphilus sp.]
AAPQQPGPAQLRQMADSQAAPLIEKLKASPNEPGLLTGIGNIYYDAQQYPVAIDYYERALKVNPSNVSVRTDLGTAYWYTGKADAALAEFDKALGYAPTNPNTLFNRGLVRWKAKGNIDGALADWQKLLAANPNYDGNAQVRQYMEQARQQAASGQAPKTK